MSLIQGLSAAGSFLSGAGSIAKALGFGGSDRQPTPFEQIENQINLEQAQFRSKMGMAKEYGLHPLTVMGMSPSQSSIVYSGSPGSRFDFGELGAGLNNALGAFVEPPQAPAPVSDAKLTDPRADRLADAQLRLAEARAGLAETQHLQALQNLIGQPGRPPGAVASNDVNAAQIDVARQSGIPLSYVGGDKAPVKVEQKVAPPHPTKKGHTAATDQGWQTVRDKDGKDVSVVRSDVINADIEKGATFQALAKAFGVERAMQITAVLENEGLALGLGAAGAFLMRHPVGRAYNYFFGKKSPYKPAWKGGK